MTKTNAVRILDGLGIAYELRAYPVSEMDMGAENAARKLGLPAGQVFKTLVVTGDKTGVMLACVPATGELNLHRLAEASGNKRVAMVAQAQVQPLTGYIRGGVSPIGTKKRYPVYLDSSALNYPFISVSAGRRGMQVFLAPHDLIATVAAQTAELGGS